MTTNKLNLKHLIIVSIISFETFCHAQFKDRLSQDEIISIVDTCFTAFKTYYIYPDVVLDIEKYVKRRIAEKQYAKVKNLVELTKRLKNDFRHISGDRHIWIDIMENLLITDRSVSLEEIINEKRKNNFGFTEFKLLKGNIAYLRIDGFNDIAYARETAIHAMGMLCNSNVVILDLRENHGGYGNMVHFISGYFFENRTKLNALYFRQADSLAEAWTDPSVPGEKLLKQKLFILTSKNTASAAESFTYTMKHYKRATVVGEHTRGAAYWKETYKFPHLGIFLEIPVARPINPVTGKDWQGEGVQPDVEVAAAEAFDRAVQLALDVNE